MKIRPYESKDRDNVRFVCLNSDGPCGGSENWKNFILTTYCDYYIEKEPQNCFVAANDNDEAVGYIICAESYEPFWQIFSNEYVDRIDKTDVRFRESAKNSTVLQNKFKKEYPAHLHIDLLPEYQRMGLGTKLVDTLCTHLKSKGIPGVMLTVGSDNNVGQSFYKKYGFTMLEEKPGDVAYGIKL